MNLKTLEQNIEPLAEEVHNAWMKEKLEQGFHAPLNCEAFHRHESKVIPMSGIPKKEFEMQCKFSKYCQKCHTDLYPYAELPENIKEYDRVTVRAVLSAIEKISE